ncbi:MAG TPA: signal recognition particle protein [Candidatus Limnocylindria bacterium]|jgi:signal recognition particle subunit SRP54|nr:signal recognition particle protein [Candidatus Limnocylindria bacterium]
MFESLSARLQGITERLRGKARITEADLDVALREIRLALLEADVNFRVVKDFVAHVRERAVGADLLSGLNPGQQIVKIVHDELVAVLGGERHELRLDARPSVVMMVGLQGSGKTTTAAKLAVRLRKAGKKPLLVAADVYRPAAVDQLVQLGDQIGVEVHTRSVGTPALEVARSGLDVAKQRGLDVMILDTAGRLHVDDAMMDELVRISGSVMPSETLLVVDAMTGQESVKVAEAFHAKLPISGLVLTKMDGDARGGAALSIRAATGLPVSFLGTGERTDGLEPFHPDRLAQRILGMGDILTFVERVQENVDQAEAEAAAKRMMENRFTLEDFRDQLNQIKKMGPIGQLVGMIPGAGQMAGAAQEAVDSGQMKRIEAIIDSMTPDERRRPEIIKASRRRRIALGSGTSTAEVNRLLKQFVEMQKMMKMLSGGKLPRLGGGLGALLGR